MGFNGAFGFHSNSQSGLIYSGAWNASTNTPLLQSGIGTNGTYYVVDVPGNTNLDGITDWQIGDWAIFNGTVWEKIDNSGITYQGNWNALTNTPTLVSSVGNNGHFYIVDVAGSTNLNGINVWNIGDWAIFTNGVWLKIGSIPGINTLNTLTSLVQTFSVGTSGSDFNINSAVSNHEFNLPNASATNRGALTSTDWTTFNGKIGGSGAVNEISYFTGSGTIASLTTATYPSLTELSYVKGVTSAIQTQINNVYIPRIQSVISSATVTPTNLNDEVVITAQAAALFFANPTGTAVQGQSMLIRIKDDGTARAITYDTQYRAIGVTLPTTTVINKTLYLGLVYNSTDTKWDVIGVAQEV